MSKPRLLDLFCGAGGCSVGYQRAGFDVTGVDLNPQPRYPFPFVRGDAIEYCAAHGYEFDAIHASPPCQGYSRMRHVTGKAYPLMIDDVRVALRATGKPYVIENVEDAPLIDDVLLCGTMFGLKTFRHRRFETSFFLLAPQHASHVHYGKCARQGYAPTNTTQYMTVTGNFGGKANGERAMGIDWMTKKELSQAIPPAYTEFIGRTLMETLS